MATIATATPRRMPSRLTDGVGERIEREGDEQPDTDAGEHRLRAAEHGDHRERAEDRDHEVDERAPVETDAQAGAGGLLGVDPQRRRLLVHRPR